MTKDNFTRTVTLYHYEVTLANRETDEIIRTVVVTLKDTPKALDAVIAALDGDYVLVRVVDKTCRKQRLTVNLEDLLRIAKVEDLSDDSADDHE